eukprot:jgi/Phyca11/116832/e_gw1.31.486.1
MRAGRREKPVTPATVPRDVDFRHLWRQLRAAGWTSKRPTGIQTEWSYTTPEGANVLLGERAVVEYAFHSGLLVEDDDDSSRTIDGDGEEHVREVGDGEDQGGEGGGGDTTVRPSQIDTSVLLSQNTIEQLFGSSDESPPQLSQTAVARAFDLSPRDLQADAEERDAAATLRHLSDASGLE